MNLLPLESIADLLALSTLTLATSGAQGEPHAAPVYFAATGELLTAAPLHLVFFSDLNSQHGQDLAANPRAAAAIYPEGHSWQDIRGLQLRGAVWRVTQKPEWDAAWASYSAKFPFVSLLKEIVARNTLYAFRPHWARLVDNRRGFGFKQEWTIP